MRKGQASLEYLIIMTAVLSISAITVLYMSGSFTNQIGTVSIATCKQAATECKLTLFGTPSDPCTECDDSCINSVSGEEIFENATYCCKQGKPQLIYDGSPGCEGTGNGNGNGGPVCGNSILETGEACDSDSVDCGTLGYEPGTNAPCLGDCSGYDASVCTPIQLQWHFETIDSIGRAGLQNSLALDSNDNPHGSFMDIYTNFPGDSYIDLKYARKVAGVWVVENVTSLLTYSGQNIIPDNSIAIDSDNNPHIAYFNISGFDLMYASKTGGSWQIEIVETTGEAGSHNSIIVDSSNNPHIAYYRQGNLEYAKKVGGVWQKQVVDSGADLGWYTSITLDTNDDPHISYFDSANWDLKYANYTAADGWHVETVHTGPAGIFSSIALDSNNAPYISHHSTGAEYAQLISTGWLKETVDNPIDNGETSIEVNSSDTPLMFYFKYSNLMYAKKIGTTWNIEILTGVDSGSKYLSSDLDSNDNPHVSYRVGNELKYAYYG